MKIKQPRNLADAIEVARLIEERNKLQKTANQSVRSQQVLATSKPNINPTPGILGPPPNQRGNSSLNTPTNFRRITNQEARERREKRLCYYCDEKFVPRHQCARPQLFMMEDSPHMSFEGENVAELESQEEVPEVPEISFHEIAGTNNPQTIRVMGKLKNKDVAVLIDGGSTHNFIDQAVTTKYGLPIDQSKKF